MGPPCPFSKGKEAALLVVWVCRPVEFRARCFFEDVQGLVEDVELLDAGDDALHVVDEAQHGELLLHWFGAPK